MRGVNSVFVGGNVTGDPEVNFTNSGIKVCNITIAMNEKFKDSNGDSQERTEYIKIQLWRGSADIVEKYVEKGDPLLIQGRLRTNEWEDRETGQKRRSVFVVASQVTLLGGRRNGDPVAGTTSQPASDLDEDLPF